MILSSKLKVCHCHSDECCDNNEDDENNKQYAIYGVNFVTPDTSKYIIQLNVNGTKGKEPCHGHLRNSAPIPWQLRNFTWIVCGATWSLEFCLAVLTSNATQHKQRQSYQGPYEDNHKDGTKWQGCSGTVYYGNSVKKAES